MIVFAYIKFGFVRIQGSGVKRGTESAPPRSERVFQIPVQIGLRKKESCLNTPPLARGVVQNSLAWEVLMC